MSNYDFTLEYDHCVKCQKQRKIPSQLSELTPSV